MARDTWAQARMRGQTASFDYYKEPVTVSAGARTVSINAVYDTGLDQLETGGGAQINEGTFPVMAKLTCWRSELGWLPETGEELRIYRDDRPGDERLYLVVTVDDTTDLIDIELQAQVSNGRPYYR